MKKILSLALVFISLSALAQKLIPSTITKVKVFKQNAEIERQAQSMVSAGRQEIVITGISTKINPSSLQIQFKNSSSELLSAKYEPNYLIPTVSNPKIDALKVSSEDIADELAWVKEQKNALLGMEDILKKNQVLGAGKVGFTPAQVVELSNNYKKKYLEIKKELNILKKEEKSLSLKLNKTKKQLNEMSAQFNNPSGTIVLQVSAKRSERLSIRCSYTVNNAGWTPIYDLRSAGITEKVKLSYRANVYQNTGQDWNNVNLIVSTGNPTQNNERPILHPLYAKINPRVYKKSLPINRAFNMMNFAQAEEKSNFKDGYTAHAQISENQMNVEFAVPNKQSISSDGKQYLMALKTYKLPTNYIYHTVPKLCNGAFLLAKVSDWGQYNLLPGQANIFFEGGFVGTSTINPEITSDTMLVSLGRDNNIVVKRNPIEKYSKKKALESKRKETIGYELVVRNKKSVPITIEVLDQIPVSQSNQIDVDLGKKGNAQYNKKIGKLLWTASINPNNSWKDEFVYTVKYPKNDVVAGLK